MSFKLLVAFLVVSAAIDLANADEKHPKFEACGSSSRKYFKMIHKVYMDCHAELKDPNASLSDQMDKLGCTVRCILKKDKMIDDNEMATDEIIQNNYKGRVIPEFEEKLKELFMDCKTKFGDKLDKADPLCKSYQTYGLCMQEAISHVCYENI